MRRQRDRSVRVYHTVRHRGVGQRQYSDAGTGSAGGRGAVRASRRPMRPTAADDCVVFRHGRMPSGRRGVHESEQRQMAAAIRFVGRRTVLHQRGYYAAAVRRPVRVLPVGHACTGRYGRRAHRHAGVHGNNFRLQAGGQRFRRRERRLRGVRRIVRHGWPVLLLLHARD